jgi:hypothetical protein
MGPYELLERIVLVLDRLHIPDLVTGSVAAMAYGEPRLTNDIDIVASVEGRHIPGLIAAFPSEEYYISEDMIREAITEWASAWGSRKYRKPSGEGSEK